MYTHGNSKTFCFTFLKLHCSRSWERTNCNCNYSPTADKQRARF